MPAYGCKRNLENPSTSPYWCNYPLWVAKFALDGLLESEGGLWMSTGISAEKPDEAKLISENAVSLTQAIQIAEEGASEFQDKEIRKFAFAYFGGQLLDGSCVNVVISGVLSGSVWNTFAFNEESSRVNRVSRENIVERCSE